MSKKLTEEQKKLIIDNLRLLDGFIRDYFKEHSVPPNMEDDFISDMHLKFCLSALNYKKEKGFQFSTYAYGGFQLGIKDIFRKKIKKIASIDQINDDYLFENVAKKEKLNYDSINDLIEKSNLTEREKAMTRDYYYDKISFSKLGGKYDLSKERSRVIVNDSLMKLKLVAEKQNLDLNDFYS